MITWLRESWPWLAGVSLPAIGLIVLAVANPAAALKLVSTIAGWLLDLVRGVIEWLRKPRTPEQKWRFACLLLGGLCAFASFGYWDARQTVVVVREKCAAEVQAVRVVATAAKNEVKGAQHEVKACRVTLKSEVGKREAIEAKAKKAIADAQRDEARAEKDAADWQRRYQQRPKGCESALMEVQQQCSTVKDY